MRQHYQESLVSRKVRDEVLQWFFFGGLRKDERLVGWQASKGAGVCVLSDFVAWDKARLGACRCDIFFFLQHFGSQVVTIGKVGLLSGSRWANRILQDPNVCVVISAVYGLLFSFISFQCLTTRSLLPIFSGRVGHTLLAWFKKIIPLQYRERWILADLAKWGENQSEFLAFHGERFSCRGHCRMGCGDD